MRCQTTVVGSDLDGVGSFLKGNIVNQIPLPLCVLCLLANFVRPMGEGKDIKKEICILWTKATRGKEGL